ncbi:MAG: cupin domain-containing protein [Turicibacter sp.]
MTKELIPVQLNELTERKTIVADNDQFKTIAFNFESGKGLPDHTHDGFATIQMIKGTVEMKFVEGREFILNAGDYLEFDARVKHHVIAQVDSKCLVTISKKVKIS